MAIDYELINKGGISLGTNFELLSEKPLDARLVVPSLDGLKNYIDNAAAYEGMIVYDQDTKKTYQVKWQGEVLGYEVFASGSGTGDDPSAVKFTQQTLEESQKAQARENIGASSKKTVEELQNEFNAILARITTVEAIAQAKTKICIITYDDEDENL